MSKRSNRDAEPSKQYGVILTPEEQRLAEELKVEFHQSGKGITGLVRALMLDAAKRLGWPSPYAGNSERVKE